MPDEIIICDKCDSNRTDVECPKPATWAKVHYGSFGHKCLHLYCDECRYKHYGSSGVLTKEEELLHEIFKDSPEDMIWELYEEPTIV